MRWADLANGFTTWIDPCDADTLGTWNSDYVWISFLSEEDAVWRKKCL